MHRKCIENNIFCDASEKPTLLEFQHNSIVLDRWKHFFKVGHLGNFVILIKFRRNFSSSISVWSDQVADNFQIKMSTGPVETNKTINKWIKNEMTNWCNKKNLPFDFQGRAVARCSNERRTTFTVFEEFNRSSFTNIHRAIHLAGIGSRGYQLEFHSTRVAVETLVTRGSTRDIQKKYDPNPSII